MPHSPFMMMKLPVIGLALWTVWRVIIQRRPISLVAVPWGVLRWFFLIALLSFSGCSSMQKPAEAKGPLFALNPGHWQPTPQDLKDQPRVER